ncbi:MAG TPA: glycosyltransferase family 1 protein [bacterium]|nr:glycosyltransferase family 1 protein [bacterium]HPN30738.1 glycosyltransferase family 1 protein [bacterium]
MKTIVLNILSVSNIYSGAGTYSLNVLNFLPECEDLRFIIFSDKTFYNNALTRINCKKKNYIWKTFDFGSKFKRIFFEQFKLPRILDNIKPDIVHSFSNILPVNYKGGQFLTLHDVMFKLFFSRYSISKQIYYNYYVSKSVKIADKIFVPTISTMNDLKRFYGYNGVEQKIKIINYSGNSLLDKSIGDGIIEKFKSKFGLTKPFVLFVGTLEPGKNIEFLYELADKIKNDCEIVIAAGKGWKTKKQRREKIKFLNNMNEIEMSALYKCAAMLAYPVIYEGVGLPLYEAQYFGIPVICSDYPAAREIVDSKNILPLNVDLWSKKINEILNDASLQIKKNNTPVNNKISGWENYCRELTNYYLNVKKFET